MVVVVYSIYCPHDLVNWNYKIIFWGEKSLPVEDLHCMCNLTIPAQQKNFSSSWTDKQAQTKLWEVKLSKAGQVLHK